MLVLGLVAPLAGCLGVHTGHPESRGPRSVESQHFAAAQRATPVRWKAIYLGAPPKPAHVGYLRTASGGLNRGGHTVFDPDFNVIGRISPKGNTVRIVQGVERNVGGYALKHAILRLHLRAKETEVDLRDMPAPRG